jgi:hypothetical protein
MSAPFFVGFTLKIDPQVKQTTKTVRPCAKIKHSKNDASGGKGGEATQVKNTLKAGCRSPLTLVPRVKSQRHFYEICAFIFCVGPHLRGMCHIASVI